MPRMFNKSATRWSELARSAPGPVMVVNLGDTKGSLMFSTAGEVRGWSDAINAIEAEGWRLENFTSPGVQNGNIYGVFRRVTY